MARKEIVIDIQDRDQLLTFKIKEMPATRLGNWIVRALLLLAGTGANVPGGTDMEKAGAYLAEHGLAALGNVDFDKASPLLDEMLGCCSRVVENVEERCTPQTVDAYIMDVKTLFRLHMEAMKLNLGFFKPEDEKPSGSREKASTAMV